MVVLEPVPSVDETNPPKSTTEKVMSAAADGYASDGYETASETEVEDKEATAPAGGDGSTGDAVSDEQQAAAAANEISYQDALNDDQLHQKILEQMNEAKVEGNKLFGDGQYEEALLKYESALQLAPEMSSFADVKSICHFNRASCFFKLGKYKDTINECTKALELNPTYMKALLRRGDAHERLENYEEAIVDLKKIVELDPSNDQARRTIVRLEPLAEEKREKLKEEMIGKLKDMGNSILGKFGMSLDSFKAVQDPNTGSYSFSYQP